MEKKKIDFSAIIITIYICLVWLFYILLNITVNPIAILLDTTIIGVLSYFTFSAIFTFLRYKNFSNKLTKKSNLTVFVGATIVTFLIAILCFLAYRPGGFSPDSINQYEQVMTATYSDWHPVWHTLCFFTLPLKLTGNVEAIVPFQIILFSFAVGYLSYAINETFGIVAVVISFAYIMLNPYIMRILMFPWKDVAFGIGALFCTVFSARLIINERKMSAKSKLVGFAFVFASITLFRHNGILFSVPLLFGIILNTEKKTWITITAFSLIIFSIIKGPVYWFLNVEKPGNRVIETMGLPLNVIANVAKEHPERMDEDLSSFVYSMAPQDKWNEYKRGDFNQIKWELSDMSIVEEEGIPGVLKLMTKCFRISPKISLDAIIDLTDLVYGVENGLDGEVYPHITENPYGIQPSKQRNEILRDFFEQYRNFFYDTCFKYLKTFGVALISMLAAALAKIKWSSWKSWKKFIWALPIFIYDFGTMLLLTGPDSRFFFVTLLVTPPVILFSLYDKEDEHV